jgi:hypothetical protein
LNENSKVKGCKCRGDWRTKFFKHTFNQTKPAYSAVVSIVK